MFRRSRTDESPISTTLLATTPPTVVIDQTLTQTQIDADLEDIENAKRASERTFEVEEAARKAAASAALTPATNTGTTAVSSAPAADEGSVDLSLGRPEPQQQPSPDDAAGTTADPSLATAEDTDLEKDTNPTSGAIAQQTFLAKMIEGPVGGGLVSSHIRINALAFDYVCSIILFVLDI